MKRRILPRPWERPILDVEFDNEEVDLAALLSQIEERGYIEPCDVFPMMSSDEPTKFWRKDNI